MKNKKAESLTGPTYLTIIRIIISILVTVFILVETPESRAIALVLFVVASLTDFIDGRWARKRKIVTNIGAFLDPLADKILINLTFLSLVYLNLVPIWIFAIILVRDFSVDGMRMMSAREGKTISASIYGKLKTTSQMIAIIIIIINLILNLKFLEVIGDITLYLALVLTVVSGADYLLKGYKEILSKPSHN
ncbi:CDP-diacylglycerol--glycerol-3-phosphate 3-phosphatidyltransferase [Candidatus Saccharibacteria bacterium]|nr:CDP-diacylglycerol--glycerol-3-phosphate 3-phosphatidyltransferase [Candidatus Saccharibacteria bacterium]